MIALLPKTIDQSGMRALIWERLEHPGLYADKPLFIWQAALDDGIQQQLAIDASLDFNKGKTRDDWSYLRLIAARDENACLKGPGEKGHLAGYVVNTSNLPLEEYLMIVNRLIDDNKSSLPLIVYLPFRYQPITLPGEQYINDPDFELWAKEGVDPTIPDFIRGDGDKAGITYRWYNRFNDQNKGCSTPCVWLAVGGYLNGFVKLTRNFRRNYGIRELDEDLIRTAFLAGMKASEDHISEDVIDDFVKYLKNSSPKSASISSSHSK